MVSTVVKVSNQVLRRVSIPGGSNLLRLATETSWPQAIRPLPLSLRYQSSLAQKSRFHNIAPESAVSAEHPSNYRLPLANAASIGINPAVTMASTPVPATNGSLAKFPDDPLTKVPDRTLDETLALLRDLEASFPKSLGEDKWYLLALSTLTYGDDATPLAHLYTYLTSQPAYATPAARQALIRRIREALVKLVSIMGVCKPLAAIWKIAEVEKEEDKDYSCSREGWQAGGESLERGMTWLGQVYRRNIDPINERFNAHKDFAWISYNITYGLYLSDHTILDLIDTEIVVLSGILIQNQIEPSIFHLRGARRVGISMADVETMHVLCEKVARFCRVRMDKTPRVAAIEHEV